jgi:hypothetical protein
MFNFNDSFDLSLSKNLQKSNQRLVSLAVLGFIKLNLKFLG